MNHVSVLQSFSHPFSFGSCHIREVFFPKALTLEITFSPDESAQYDVVGVDNFRHYLRN